MYKSIIFDLDGTLLNTLIDIRSAINAALKQCGYDYSYSLKESKTLIGNGTDMLVRRALREIGDDEAAFAQLKSAYLPLYESMQNLHTKPYNGLPEVLRFLKDKGVGLMVATNKPEKLAKELLDAQFGHGFFLDVGGSTPNSPVKPDPIIVNRFVDAHNLDKGSTLFVGDSYVDVDTAHNANIKCCLVKWGYGFYKKALLEKADYVISKPKELVRVALGKE